MTTTCPVAESTESIAQIFSKIFPQFLNNPYYYFKKLRDDAPISLVRPGLWIATGYNVIDAILKDNKRFGDNFWNNKIYHYGEQARSELCFQVMSGMLLMQNEPDHSKLRQYGAAAFSPQSVAPLAASIRKDAHAYIDKIIDQREMNLLLDFARPFAASAVYDIYGIPLKDHQLLLKNLRSVSRVTDPPVPLMREEIDQLNDGIKFIVDYMQELVTGRYNELNDGLIKTLTIMLHKNQLTYHEWVAQTALSLLAVIDTTPHLIGNALLALFQHPAQLEKLKHEIATQPTLSANTVTELLRYDPPFQLSNREAFEDVIFDDVLIKKGERIILCFGAANRDPTVFSNPDILDLSRPKKRILSYGGGIHNCLGLHLANIQIPIAFETLFQRLPNLMPDNLNDLEWKPSYTFRGLKSFKVRW